MAARAGDGSLWGKDTEVGLFGRQNRTSQAYGAFWALTMRQPASGGPWGCWHGAVAPR